ncbi:xaa-Pro aminopeptidase 1-like isoform X2 [Babylonia areolata]|uniref:xaa-Pro aminopeptidase 1-like isoform X2 n=1 Tax=Babylonia areolata TaxID=304850 RepID=UPI003FD4B4DF
MDACKFYLLWSCLLASVLVCTCGPVHEEDTATHPRHKRAAPSLGDRTKCQPGDEWPPTRVNTTQRLADMRRAMSQAGVHAFLVFSDDAHGSEYPALSDQRRGFISGFTGSAGYAAVTLTQAALWTDGRYFLEAEDALDCNWIFMRQGETDVPTLTGWLTSVLTSGQSVGADPFLVTNSQWQTLESALTAANITMEQVTDNPVDAAWTDKPAPPMTPINAWDLQYAGKSWQEKVLGVQEAMEERGLHGAYVVTSLDEVAWLFNLRATDIEYNPFFIAYAVVEYYGQSSEDNKVSLYIYDRINRLTAEPTDPETRDKLHVHLNTNENGSCTNSTGMCVEVRDYNSSQLVEDVASLAAASPDNKIWVTFLCNYAIFAAIPPAQRFQARSYVALTKSQKNPTERRGMEVCYNRDSAVLVEFLAKIERDITEGSTAWSEVSAAAELKRMRMAADKNRGLSFPSIAGSGPNGAVIHYRPSNDTDRPLTTDEMFLLDSGGQYIECTTDVTRTMHYGTPTDFMIECYTRVLMGSIDLADLIWPEGLYGREIDMAARAPLWAVGLEYRHGTGHGIGAYLSVHEGPGFISMSRSDFYSHETLLPYMFFSDEPGYYEPDQFGIRLETIVMVDPTNTTHKFGDKQFLRFKPITFVPFEPKLIDYTLMSAKQIQWLNNYHQQTQEIIEPLLTSDLAKNWLRERTKAYVPPSSSPTGAAPRPLLTFTSLLLLLGLGAAFTLLI